jgi:hypothetical protein
VAVQAGRAELPIVPTLVRSFSRDLATQMAGPAVKASTRTGRDSGRRFGTSFSGGIRTGIGPVRGIVRGFGPQLAAAFGGAALVGAIKSVTDEARESAKVGRQTAAVLKATGGIANVTAGDVDRLATSLSRKVAVDDEIIASGQNMLLTFKGVRNEVGRGNDIFDQATAAAVDMTAAMNGGVVTQEGLQASSIRLGKALNDPVAGVTALTRVGVTFTQKQKDQIAALVEAGDTMAAQKIILGELKTEFGGAAAAAADPWQRVGVALAEVKEYIGTVLQPVLDGLARWFTVKIPQAVTVLTEALTTAKTWWEDNRTAVKDLAGALSGFFTPAVKDATTRTGEFNSVAEQAFSIVKDSLVVLGQGALAWLFLERGVIKMYGAVGTAITAIGTAINAIDLLSGGTGHAGDAVRDFGRDLREKAAKELKEVAVQAKATQTAIDALKGKNVDITAQTGLIFSKSFTAVDWSHARQAAGRMAAGGLVRGPGGPTADRVPAMLSAGEAVVPARLVPALAPFLGANNVPGFAAGGLARRVDQTGVAHTGVGRIMDKWGTLILAAGVKALMGAGSPAIKAFIRSTDPLNYFWGGAGPNTYDCSGLVGAVALAHRGKPYGHGQRVWTTSSIRPGMLGIKPGLGGVLDIGVTSGTGHMAGRYGGLGFEAESSRTGIKVGAAASRPESFARKFHLAAGGRIDQALVALFARAGADIGGDPGKLRINGRVADNGAVLSPGLNVLHNRTGRPEPLVPAGGVATTINLNVNLTGGVFTDQRSLQDLANRLEPKMRTAMLWAQRRSGVPPNRQLR